MKLIQETLLRQNKELKATNSRLETDLKTAAAEARPRSPDPGYESTPEVVKFP